jgi:hypothetical protein
MMIGPMHAQIDSAEVYRQLFEEDEQLDPVLIIEDNNYSTKLEKPEKDEDEDEGIPIFVSIQPALYFPNNANANYYNGSVKDITYNQNYIIQTVWDNTNNKRTIKDDLFLNDDQYNSVKFNESNFNYNMKYDIGLMIGFQAFVAFKPRLSLMLDFNFVSLNTASYITISVPDYESPNPDINSNVIKMNVYGKEQRFITDLGVHYIIGKQSLKYYVEGGANLLMAKSTDNYFTTGEEGKEHTWNLKQTTNNTAQSTITSITFGGFAGAGLFFKMNEDFAFELGTAVAVNNVKFPGYDKYLSNIQLNIRIIYLSKNSKL